jgi:hypothetical protein
MLRNGGQSLRAAPLPSVQLHRQHAVGALAAVITDVSPAASKSFCCPGCQSTAHAFLGRPPDENWRNGCASIPATPLGRYSEPGGLGDLAPISLVTTTADFNLTDPRHVDRSMSIEMSAGSRAPLWFIETRKTRSAPRQRMITRESYLEARQCSLRIKASNPTPTDSAVAIASSNFASVVNVYQIHPDLSITKSTFRNVTLAVMRFEHAERRDQNA